MVGKIEGKLYNWMFPYDLQANKWIVRTISYYFRFLFLLGAIYIPFVVALFYIIVEEARNNYQLLLTVIIMAISVYILGIIFQLLKSYTERGVYRREIQYDKNKENKYERYEMYDVYFDTLKKYLSVNSIPYEEVSDNNSLEKLLNLPTYDILIRIGTCCDEKDVWHDYVVVDPNTKKSFKHISKVLKIAEESLNLK